MERKYFHEKNKRGFSLVEIMIVIFIVSVGLVGVISFFNASLGSQIENKQELIANGLAQEGAELMRNLRDYRILKGATWNDLIDPLPSNLFSLTDCGRIDYRSLLGNPHDCENGVSSKICFSSGKYKQCDNISDVGIGMTREISMLYDSGENCLRITSTVKWNDRTTVAVDVLYENEF